MQNFEKIRSIVMSSSLSGDEKMKLVDTFANIPDSALEYVAKLFEKDPSWVAKLSENRKKKEEAFATGNRSLWQEIFEEEKQYMADLTYDLD